MGIFQNIVLKKYLSSLGEKTAEVYEKYRLYFLNLQVQENIKNSKEEQFQEGFLRELFVKVLGYSYTLNPDPNFNLITEKKNEGRVWWRYSRPMHKEYYHLPKVYCSRRAFNNTFCYDAGFEYLGFSNMTVIFETNSNFSMKYILSLLNSKLLNYRYRSIGKQTGGGSFEYFPNGVGKLPIPQIDKSAQQPFIELVDRMLELNKTLNERKQKIINRLAGNFEGLKVTKALEKFDKLEFKAFVAELRKQKITLSLKQQDEWEESHPRRNRNNRKMINQKYYE